MCVVFILSCWSSGCRREKYREREGGIEREREGERERERWRRLKRGREETQNRQKRDR